jgi:hypothetical protein
MPNYCVNTRAQANGDHEVHDLTPGFCPTLPAYQHRQDLGYHSGCESAVRMAKTMYRQSNGCAHCCSRCNTG